MSLVKTINGENGPSKLSYSPDGSKLLVHNSVSSILIDMRDNNRVIYTLIRPRPSFLKEELEPSWSPDSSKFAITKQQYVSTTKVHPSDVKFSDVKLSVIEFYIYDTSTDEPLFHSNIYHDMKWSPDGSMIAFAKENEINVFDSTNFEPICNFVTNDATKKLVSISWTPKYTILAYIGNTVYGKKDQIREYESRNINNKINRRNTRNASLVSKNKNLPEDIEYEIQRNLVVPTVGTQLKKTKTSVNNTTAGGKKNKRNTKKIYK